MRNTLILLIILIVPACNEAKQQSTDLPLLDHYLVIKDALVATNGSDAQAEAQKMLKVTSDPNIQGLVENIASSDDVRVQREAFNQLSQYMLNWVKTNQTDVTLYKQYCPMAFFNKGAYWLSTEEQVMNPYFGELMLTCGEVKEVIQSND